MKKIDPHHHLWDVTSNMYSWLKSPVENNFLGNYQSLQENYLINDYLKDCANHAIVKSVHVQAGFDSDKCVEETKWLQNIADNYGFPHGIVAYVNLAASNADDLLNAHCKYPNMRGIRQCLNWHTQSFYKDCKENYIDNLAWQKGFVLLEKYNLSFDMQIYPDQMVTALKLAKQYPNINIIINHIGMPFWQDDINLKIWQERMTALSSCKNVYVKLSGFGMIKHDWKLEDIESYFKFIVETYGANRCMFASNFPVDRLYGSFDKLYNTYTLLAKKLTMLDQENLFYHVANKVYRL